MSLNIHPTAIIESGAKIHSSVSVGPYSVIKKNVVIEENTSVGAYVLIDGNTHIGKNNTIFSHNSIGQAPQDKKYKNELTKLIIGESNTIREFCTINTGTEDDKKLHRLVLIIGLWLIAMLRMTAPLEITSLWLITPH